MIDENLRQELLNLRHKDFVVRERLAETGALFDGYNAEMKAVHLENAARLAELLDENGVEWFGKSIVGEDGAEAAWIIVQHAISVPELSRKMLPVLQSESEKGEIPAWHAALLEDRILAMEGKPQIYGSQFDWKTRDAMSANEIFEPENIDERRAAVGLFVPYAEYVKQHNDAVCSSNEIAPEDLEKRQRDFEIWARKVGWRE